MNKVRTLQMVDYVMQRRYCSTDELMRAFQISPATVRRDIADMVRANYLRKVHGGVAVIEAAPEVVRPADDGPLAQRIRANPEQKAQIARFAASLIASGDILFLDSSTTALSVVRQLQKSTLQSLTIVTNSVPIIQEFRLLPARFVLLSVGGSFNAQLNSFLGKAALDALRRFQIDKAFLSAAGITSAGLFTYHESHAEFLKAVLDVARETCFLLDSNKFNKIALFDICPLDGFDTLISDANPPASIGTAVKLFRLAQPLGREEEASAG
jgi:DeoR/GlpR family transcriptional regulator of sugar metabolism